MQAKREESSAQEAKWTPRARIYMVIRLLNGRIGGAERLFCDLANILAEEGYDVTILYCDSRQEPPYFPLSPKVTRINLWGKTARRAPWYRVLTTLAGGYRHIPILAPVDWLSKNLYFSRRLHAAARMGKPDVIISFLPPANTPSLLAGWLTGAKVVPTNHSVPEHDYESPVRWDQNPIDKALRRWALDKAERVHVQFPAFAEWFPDDIRGKTVAIPNFVSDEFVDVAEPDERSREIVAVGRLSPLKGYMTLVEAWALIADKHPEWKVRLYGGGPQRRELLRKMGKLDIEDSFELMGWNNDMKSAYVQGEIFCHPSLVEGFGLAVAEALSCGLPVVVFNDCAGVCQFVKDGYNGVVIEREGGPKALADALERLITDEELRQNLRDHTRESVRAFQRDQFCERWVKLIEELVP